MADRYRTPDGWTVEVVQLAAGERLRIRHQGFYVADVLSVDDLARWIPAAELAQLERDTLIRAVPGRRPGPGRAAQLRPDPRGGLNPMRPAWPAKARPGASVLSSC
jgi:hypothetical protein